MAQTQKHKTKLKHTRTYIQGLTLLGTVSPVQSNDDYTSFLRDPQLSLVSSVRLLEQY